VEVIPAGGGAPTAVVKDLVLTRQDGTTYVHHADPTTLRFEYRNFNDNINSLLAEWDSTGDAKWLVRLSTYDLMNNLVGTPNTHMIQLDNTWPQASIEIITGAGNCGKFSIGTVLSGTFVARDTNLGSYSLGVIPGDLPGVPLPSPHSGSTNTAVAPGDTWTLHTAGMQACGYVIQVSATDLAIVNSQGVGHTSSDSAGFCLEEEEHKM
jgi:hypothetical protein